MSIIQVVMGHDGLINKLRCEAIMAKKGTQDFSKTSKTSKTYTRNSSKALRHGPKTEKCPPTLDCFIPKRFDWLASGKSHPLHPNCYGSRRGLMHDAVNRVSDAEMKSSWYVTVCMLQAQLRLPFRLCPMATLSTGSGF